MTASPFNEFQAFVLNYVSPTAIITLPEADETWSHYNFEEFTATAAYVGDYAEIDPAGTATDAILTEFLAAIQLECGGRVISGMDPAELIKGISLQTAFLSCWESGANFDMTITILNAGTFAQVFTIWTDPNVRNDTVANLLDGVRTLAIEYSIPQ